MEAENGCWEEHVAVAVLEILQNCVVGQKNQIQVAVLEILQSCVVGQKNQIQLPWKNQNQLPSDLCFLEDSVAAEIVVAERKNGKAAASCSLEGNALDLLC